VAERVIDILNDLAKSLGIRVLTPEYQIALFLIDRPNVTSEELLRNSCLSSTGFFNTLDHLKHWGIVTCEQSPVDKRSKLYRLTDAATGLIIARFQRYRAARDEFNLLGLRRSDLPDRYEGSGDVRLNHLTCEYQIILRLYISPGLRNSEIREKVNVSTTKFNTALVHLVNIGLLEYDCESSGGRRKKYRVTARVERLMDDIHARLFDWIADVEAR
jgi:DNA-binding MarR family transcriptional regulator